MTLWGACIPPTNSTTLVYIQDTIDFFATLRRPLILVGDQNITRDSPEYTKRGAEIVQFVVDTGLIDMQHRFKRGSQSCSTWHKK